MPAQARKAHKSRFATKGEAKRKAQGRTASAKKAKNNFRSVKLTKAGSVEGTKERRRQKNNQIRDAKRKKVVQAKRIGKMEGPPRIVGFIGLSSLTDPELMCERVGQCGSPVEGLKYTHEFTDRKLRVSLVPSKQGDLDSELDVVKVADVLVLVVKVVSDAATELTSAGGDEEDALNALGVCVDEMGQKLVAILTAFGLPATFLLLDGLHEIPSLKRQKALAKVHERWIKTHVSEAVRVMLMTPDQQGVASLLRACQECKLTERPWKKDQSFVLVEGERWIPQGEEEHLGVMGYLRGPPISPDQLFHFARMGTFPCSGMQIYSGPDQIEETLLNAHPTDPAWCQPPEEGEQTWPTAADYASAQAASPENAAAGTGGEGEEGDGAASEKASRFTSRTFASEMRTQVDSLMATDFNQLDGLSPEQILEERERLAKDRAEQAEAAGEDRDFPDEIDTPFHIPARERFIKYRGLPSFRTSRWDPYESLPQDYSRIFSFQDFAHTKKVALAELTDYPAPSDSLVLIVLKGIKREEYDEARRRKFGASMTPVVSALRPHEHQYSVCHLNLQFNGDYHTPIKSKESLLVHCGFRVLRCCPVYSEPTMAGSKAKMMRFFQPEDKFAVASIYGPVMYAPTPVLCFKTPDLLEGRETAELVSWGSVMPPDPLRCILKKVMLTGYPHKVHKRVAVVKMMFFNGEDVEHFKPVRLYTKLGHSGGIKCALGTHGMMKCQFNHVIQGHDVVRMDLWKRVYPKWNTAQVSLLPSVEAEYTCIPTEGPLDDGLMSEGGSGGMDEDDDDAME